jgi:hypothetical protein
MKKPNISWKTLSLSYVAEFVITSLFYLLCWVVASIVIFLFTLYYFIVVVGTSWFAMYLSSLLGVPGNVFVWLPLVTIMWGLMDTYKEVAEIPSLIKSLRVFMYDLRVELYID